MKCQVARNDNGLGLFNDFRREFDGFFGHILNDDAAGSRAVVPSLNLMETDMAYEVSLDLPGVNPDDVDVQMKDGALWISGERKAIRETADENGKKWHRVESHYGSFRRAVKLTKDVSADEVSAEYRDGVLTIVIPKRESAQPRKIAIKR